LQRIFLRTRIIQWGYTSLTVRRLRVQEESGRAHLTTPATLFLQGNEIISNVIINCEGDEVYIQYGTVTFASNSIIDQTVVGNTTSLFSAVNSAQTIFINDGSIDAASNGGAFDINGLVFKNAGSIAVSNGDTLDISVGSNSDASFTNTGTISIDGTSTFEIDMNLTTAQLLHLNDGVSVYGSIAGGTVEGSMDETLSGGELLLSGNLTVANATIDIGAASTAGFAIVNIGGGTVTIASTATINQTVSGTAAFLGDDVNASDATSNGTVVNDGIIIAGVSGSAMGVDPATLTNAGLVEASNGGEVLVGSNDFTNLPGSTLTGGSYEAAAGGTFEFVALTTVVTDDATIILSGASATMDELNPTTNAKETIQSTLTSTGTSGALEILGGADWTQSTAFTNAGTIQLGGGTFQVSSLTSSGMIDGFGTVGEAVSNTGALVALGGTLNVEDGSLSGYSGGALSTVTLGAGANATLQLPGNVSITTLDSMIELTGVGAAIQSLNGSAEVTVQSTLKTIAASGTLIVGDSYSSSNAIANAGTIQMAGGTLSTGTLTDSTGSNLNGYGTVASVFDDSGSVTSSTGALVFTGTDDTFAGTLGGQQIDFGGGTDTVAERREPDSSERSRSPATHRSDVCGKRELCGHARTLGAGTVKSRCERADLERHRLERLAGTISGTGTL
jgi:hypothetical protein